MRRILMPMLLFAMLMPAGLDARVPHDDTRLAQLEAQAARGDAAARYRYARALYRGGGDRPRAYAEMRLAAMTGSQDAQRALPRMRRRVSPIERAHAADMLAAALIPTEIPRETPADAPIGPRLVAAWWPSDEAGSPDPIASSHTAAPPPPSLLLPPPPATLRLAVIADRAAGDWSIQLGAFRLAGGAERHWTALGGTVARFGALRPRFIAAGGFTRLQIAGLDRARAQAICARITAGGDACFAIGPRPPLRIAAQTYRPAKQI